MTNLFALTGQALALQRQIEESAALLDDLETLPDAVEALEALLNAEHSTLEALATKADAYCWVIDQFRAQAEARNEHAQRLKDLARKDEIKANMLQDIIIACLRKVSPDATEWRLPGHRLASRRSTVVQVDARPEDLPEQFRRVKTTVEPDKTAIKEALKAGQLIPGAELIERRTWSIQ
jgi:vacuolar-type H+-ATPase subunit I/STV1